MADSHQLAFQYPPHGQFLRVEKYAIRAPVGKQGGNNVDKVALEAVRAEGHCPHVAAPLAPILRYGVDPIEAARLAKLWSGRQRGNYLHKASHTTKTRKLRDDQPCALVGVITVPAEWQIDQRWHDFSAACLEWLLEKYGSDRLTSLVEHHDERCLHLHFWIIPRMSDAFSSVHDGERAIEFVGRKAPKIIRDAAYRKAMAELLDDFHRRVGSRFGLMRETVRSRRKTRQEWLRDKFLDEQREKQIQRRIHDAVAKAVADTKVLPSTPDPLVTSAHPIAVQQNSGTDPSITVAYKRFVFPVKANPIGAKSLPPEMHGEINQDSQISIQRERCM